MKRKKEEESTILYQQYQESNEFDTDTEEDLEEQEDLYGFDEKKERRKNIVIYSLLVAVVGVLAVLLLVKFVQRDTTQVVYKDTGSSNRIVKSGVGRISSVSDNSVVDDLEEITADTEETNTEDLYELAVAEGFTGTREEFFNMLTKWNISEKELQKDISELKSLVGSLEDGKDGENGRNGVDGKAGTPGKDGSSGKNGKSAYEIAVENGSANGKTETEWSKGLNGTDGKDGATGKSAYEIAVEDGSAEGMTEAEWSESLKGEKGDSGKTTYLAYADDNTGTNFSLYPLTTSKYIGTCITDKTTQPKTAGEYSWQVYKTYVITSIVEDGVTTVYIN